MNIDQKYMSRAIQLGKNALGTAAPNPMVGAILVYNDTIIGEGFTSPHGGPHAEVNAIANTKDKTLLSKATLYVTLEPCSHFGKTPPCSDLIVKHRIPKVVIGLTDPNPKVAGKGIVKLKEAGTHVIVGVLENECCEHHKRFLTFQEKKRPYIILKWAETADGFIAPEKKERHEQPEPHWITGTNSRQLVHQWRSEEMAILVGTNTVLEDNPKLDVRNWTGKNPIRVVLDKELKISNTFNVLDKTIPTIVLNGEKKVTGEPNLVYEKIDFKQDVVLQICEVLHKNEINSVIIEGGAKTIQCFSDANLWDEARIFKGQSVFGNGVAAPKIEGKPIAKQQIVNDSLIFLKND